MEQKFRSVPCNEFVFPDPADCHDAESLGERLGD